MTALKFTMLICIQVQQIQKYHHILIWVDLLYKAHKVTKVNKVIKVNKVLKALTVLKVSKVHKALKVRKANKVLKDSMENQLESKYIMKMY